MRLHLRPWQLAIVAVVFCCAALAALLWRANHPYDAKSLLSLLPPNDATVGYVDTKVLRESGILDLIAGPKAAEEPDYRHFVEQTGFDYRTDLDHVAAAFLNDGSYFALQCRFQWKQLEAYAASQGGACYAHFCTMPGSTGDRNISFYPVQADILALAVTKEPGGASHIHADSSQSTAPSEAATAPVWFSWPSFSSFSARWGPLPPVAQIFFAPLAQARSVILAAGPDGKHSQQLHLRLYVTCASPGDAKQLVERLTSSTNALAHASSAQAGNPLSGILAAGTFQQRGNILQGGWPLDRAVLEKLTAAGTP